MPATPSSDGSCHIRNRPARPADSQFRLGLACLLLALLGWSVASRAATEVNDASQARLESIKGIGPVVSEQLLEERRKAPFLDWDDLLRRVKGLGQRSAAALSAGGLTVNGAAFRSVGRAAATSPAAPASPGSAALDTRATLETPPSSQPTATPRVNWVAGERPRAASAAALPAPEAQAAGSAAVRSP
jgi:competence protein ComEA